MLPCSAHARDGKERPSAHWIAGSTGARMAECDLAARGYHRQHKTVHQVEGPSAAVAEIVNARDRTSDAPWTWAASLTAFAVWGAPSARTPAADLLPGEGFQAVPPLRQLELWNNYAMPCASHARPARAGRGPGRLLPGVAARHRA